MPAPISVIIPTLNSEFQLPLTLWSIMEGVDAGLIREVIITDGGSIDKTQNISLNWGAEFVIGTASRGGQLRRGVERAKGSYLLVVHSDTILEEGWASELQEDFFAGPKCFSFAFGISSVLASLVALWANFRTDWLRLPYGDQALFISRKQYDIAGGYPDQMLMEDIALVMAVEAPIKRMRSRAFTSSVKYENEGWFRNGFKNLILLFRYFLGANPDKLAQLYYSSVDPD